MSDFKSQLEEYLQSSDALSRRHVHPRLMKMFELGGMGARFERAEGQYMWDGEGNRYLDFLCGGGVYLMGRNQAKIHEALMDTLSMNLPNMTVVNASALGGLLAQKLIDKAGGRFSKVVYANSGSESTEVALRFARQVTNRRRFLYLEGAFHGRSYGAISVCGFREMRTGVEPAMPTCTPIEPGNLRALRRELKVGDVAALIFEPVQGMTGEPVDVGFLREAENLCNQYGTLLIADEVQTGLGRTGHWFTSTAQGIRPDIMTTSKALSGGAVPVAAVLVDEGVYDKVFSGFSNGLMYFSTFAENNLAMVAGITTIDLLEELDAPALAAEKGAYLRSGLEDIASRYDCIDRVTGMGMMQTVYLKESATPHLALQQKAMMAADKGAFAAAVHVDLFARQKIIAQIPGPGVNAVKILPPVVATDEDLDYFLNSFEDTVAQFYGRNGPVVSLGRGVIDQATKAVSSLLPGAMPSLVRGDAAEKKSPSSMN
mgnify:CR=1 FL=1